MGYDSEPTSVEHFAGVWRLSADNLMVVRRSAQSAGSAVLIVALLLVSLSMLSRAASTSQYIIRFEEGAYSYDASKSAADLNNKYLAKVTVEEDGNVLTTARGSTLPDSY